jgi:hypothetical protein
MGRRLLFGSKSALARLGVVGGREIFPIHGAEDDDSANSGDDSGNANDDDGEDEDSDEDEDDSDKPAAKRRTRARSSEFNRLKRERNALLREKQDRDKKEREAELKDKSEAERAVAERDDAVKAHTDLSEKYQQVVTELEIIKVSNQKKLSWNDIEDVLNDRTLRKAIEIGEDGEITGVDEALKDLAKRKPHFLAKKLEDDDKGKGGNGQNGSVRQSTGTATGGQPNGGSGNDRTADRQRLVAKYGALQRLPQ